MRILRFLSPLLLLFGLDAVLAAPLQTNPEEAKLYPYVVPEAAYYPRGVADQEAAGATFKLGHGLAVALVHDNGGLVHNVSPEELRQAHLTAAQAREIALRNLQSAIASGTIGAKVFDAGPEGRPFILFSGHWLASSCILLPDLYDLASKRLGTTDILVSVPNRDAMLVFPKGDAHYRQAMRALIREKESDGLKPLTFKLFGLTKAGPVEDDKE
jgi:hypothetical protein